MSDGNKNMLKVVLSCVDAIDDHFEYRYESEKDKEVVVEILNTMHNKLQGLTQQGEK
jgi:hypothetical protein